jgi:hypothetical protein
MNRGAVSLDFDKALLADWHLIDYAEAVLARVRRLAQ